MSGLRRDRSRRTRVCRTTGHRPRHEPRQEKVRPKGSRRRSRHRPHFLPKRALSRLAARALHGRWGQLRGRSGLSVLPRAPEATFLSKYARAFRSNVSSRGRPISRNPGVPECGNSIITRSVSFASLRIPPSPGHRSSTVADSAARTSAGIVTSGSSSSRPHRHPTRCASTASARTASRAAAFPVFQPGGSSFRSSPGAFGESGAAALAARRPMRTSPGTILSHGESVGAGGAAQAGSGSAKAAAMGRSRRRRENVPLRRIRWILRIAVARRGPGLAPRVPAHLFFSPSAAGFAGFGSGAAGPATGTGAPRTSPVGSPRFARILRSTSPATSGFSRKNCLAFSRP